ncbi:two-component system, response regulator YesN [Paenibacillus sophorae]|uniref:Response regulator n=1 Tax=Paenibacillus sophorae TaxID=1333845 RepID=A0A1H8UN06_9BACL|nr:response regulator [Paenibacillus sophorae]QWU13315.1 response regulator [Paenibacillus sophorae]SEP04466.1 two-component system, response regulator YesN [Paenibacillus sophorae]
MYKVLITDDEWLIREGLKQTIDWQALECEIVAEASNGEQSLQAVKDFKPDILLTDIRMPVMNGMQLAEEAQRIHPNIRIIFLTGFDDFTYAQQAVKLKVADFILKPTNPDELLEVIEKVCGEIKASRENETVEQELREWVAAGYTIVLEKLLHDQLLGISNSKSLKMLTEIIDNHRLCNEGFRIALIQYEDHNYWHEQLKDELHDRLWDILMGPPVTLGGNRAALMIGADSGDNGKQLWSRIQEISGKSQLAIGLSLSHRSFDSMGQAHSEAVAALHFKRPGPGQKSGVHEFGDIEQWGEQPVTLDAANFKQVEAFIQTRYAEEISLQLLAAQFHVSEAHFSRLFRKATGTTFIDYVTQVRMEKAMELLCSPDSRIYEVSLAVGYQDSRYFSQLFRKATGKTPTEFRKDREFI